jgi:energy-coupling factor transport system permease protein
MIALKLFPNMKKRLATLKEIYSIRGVNFEDRSLIGRLRAYLPILSILLEDSLETSFDIGEAAYSRGFLSSSRSVYERQRIRNIDLTVIATMAILLIIFLIFSAFGIKNSSIYEVSLYESVFTDGIQYILMIFSVLYVELVYIWRKLKKDELYTN